MPERQIYLFDETCFKCSEIITKQYSTSFSIGIRAFNKRFRYPIYAIYGFVRYADEIVDTLHGHNQRQLLADFKQNTFEAIRNGVSLNPVLQAFQLVVNSYGIEHNLVDQFLCSMGKDLDRKTYDAQAYREYIYGSAETVGLMCLRVFCGADGQLYCQLLPYACRLGAAFQKVNFLRDIKSDMDERGRVYFPGVDFKNFTLANKQLIEADIENDFDHALQGIRQLPEGAGMGVYIAYVYYRRLFEKIRKLPPAALLQKRIRINNGMKIMLYAKAALRHRLNKL